MTTPPPAVTAEMVTALQDELSAAANALHEIVAAMGVRALLAKPETTRKAYELLKDKQRTDKQIEMLAANAFERAVTVLAKLGYPSTSVHSCNPTEGDHG